ncbi:MAG TPA: ribosome small subunit-dependent GTPase A [Burkholderiales bacterium]|nr:ribosome small subunit-dependent GTPase A [Burkholderiales bacterium]
MATHGRHYLVEVPGGELLTCFPRGKRSLLACGDFVQVACAARGQGVIEAVDPRRVLLYRSDQYRQKLIAANVTQMVIVLAVVPSFYEELLNRCLAAAVHQGIHPLIVLNKFDLALQSEPALESLALYEQLGYTVLPLVAKREVAPLRAHLQGHLTVLVGQSGMGKSTIVNALVPSARAVIGDISVALDSGRHTTTHTRLYRLDDTSSLIDSPGMQEFGLRHLTARQLSDAFVDFRPYLGQCRFNDCQHVGEPGCAVQAAQASGRVSSRRLDAYRRIAADLKAAQIKPRPSGRA